MLSNKSEYAFASIIDRYVDFELFHYSHPDSSENQKYEQRLGKSIIELACIVKASMLKDVDEKEVSTIFPSIYSVFKSFIVSSFNKTDAYRNVKFGKSFLETDADADGVVLSLFMITIAKISRDNLTAIINLLIKYIPSELPNDSANFKTILQEYVQSNKLPLPKYEVISIDGPNHKQTFTVSCLAGDAEFVGEGASKRKAEQNAAQVACDFYNCSPKSISISDSSDKNYFQSPPKKFHSDKVNAAFGFPKSTNLVQAFIPPRLRKELGVGMSSNRRLATVGSFYIMYIKALCVLECALSGKIADGNAILLASEKTSNVNLSMIFRTNLINKIDLPFVSHDDYNTLSYQVDCVQALFGMHCFEMLLKDNSRDFIETDALSWLKKTFHDALRAKVKPKENLISIVVRKLQRIGFTTRVFSIENTWGLRVDHIRTGGCYELYLEKLANKDTKAEVVNHLAGQLLKAVDRFEGSYLQAPKTSEAIQTQRSIVNYLLNNTIEDNKENDEVINLINEQKNESDSLGVLTVEELANEWSNESLSLLTKAKVLYRLHESMWGSSTNLTEFDYCYLPAVFESFAGVEPISIADIIFDIDKSNVDDNQAVEQALASSVFQEVQKPKPKIHSQNKPEFKSAEISNKDILDLEQYSLLSLDELEEIWENRLFEFEFKEEAAAVLSLIRYERGIDFKAVHYLELCKSELINNLDLPSFANSASRKACEGIDEHSIREIRIATNEKKTLKLKTKLDTEWTIAPKSSFKPDTKDERVFTNSRRVNRIGQREFRQNLINIWGGGCCISGSITTSALDAAHIAPYRGEKDNDVRNGLLLRADLHRLFDEFLIAINPDDLTIRISPDIDDATYSQFEGKVVEPRAGHEISQAALQYHWLYFIEQQG